jgi:hypothetical protein
MREHWPSALGPGAATRARSRAGPAMEECEKDRGGLRLGAFGLGARPILRPSPFPFPIESFGSGYGDGDGKHPMRDEFSRRDGV